MDMIRSQSGNKTFNWGIIASDVFNIKRARLTIKYIICVKKFWRRHQQTISKKSRKRTVKSILDGIKKTKLTTEVVETCESQRTASPTHQ